MSVAVKRWANRQEIADPTLKKVLVALAGAADSTGVSDLRQDEIAARSSISDRACRSALSVLAQFGVIRREKRGAPAEGGRLSDLIHFATDQTFNLEREAIRMCRKGSGSYRKEDAGKVAGVSGTVPVTPSDPLACAHNARACASSTDLCKLVSDTGARGRVWFDRARRNWRAVLIYEGHTLYLGRHESEDLAEAECRVRLLDIEHASRTKTGTPRDPVHRPDLDALNGQALADFLFGADEKQVRREAAGQGVKGTSSLAGSGAEPRGQQERT